MQKSKTVFWGPFVGELGWEVLFWQGWVRKLCQSHFKDYRKIVCSYPGREPFYPYVDEFWPLSEEFLKLQPSAQGYFTDCWVAGHPGEQYKTYTVENLLDSARSKKRPVKVSRDRPLNRPDVFPAAQKMVDEAKKKLGPDAIFFVPWERNVFTTDKLEFGINMGRVPKFGSYFTQRIDFNDQLIEKLAPTSRGRESFEGLFVSDRELIALFPRCRTTRRPDKNWPKEKYERLIEKLMHDFPDKQVAILGAPGGAYFAEGVPKGCLDLINVPADQRIDIQLAALEKSAFALGSMSGALLFALAAGCPTLIWGHLDEQHRYHYENLTGAPLIYYPNIAVDLDVVGVLVHSLVKNLEWQRPMKSPSLEGPQGVVWQ